MFVSTRRALRRRCNQSPSGPGLQISSTVSPTAGTAPDAAAAAAAPARMPPAANARAASLSGAVAAETAAANGLRAGAGAADARPAGDAA